jgi:adenosylhomocysteine nucleosidase
LEKERVQELIGMASYMGTIVISRFSLRPEYIELATKSAERYLAMDLTADVPKNTLANFGITSPKVRTGLIVTGDQLIADADLRNRLGRGIPVEMEGAAVAQVCHERNVPLIVVRTISDKGIVRQFIIEV